ncbi:translation elongation factor Ts [Olsenella massiliensis]|uniref:translation elongation factor Ts n=1 Tax=Olsenella massiliensis TaxID=1622075 RepID=UPI00071CAF99|nr:translation elongation factor Ts [Olsenella massiliensis]
MANVTAAMVKQLREMTDSPMMECKKALVEADGDIEKAVDVLRKMGVAKAVKRAGRDTNEGTIATHISEDGKVGAILELTCETDFVGTNPKFTDFAAELAKVVAQNDPADVEALKACAMGDATVADELTEMIHVIGENMKIARFRRVSVEDGALSSYVHLGGKLADLAWFSLTKAETAQSDAFKVFAHDVAMQVAAAAPVAARREDVPAETVEHEKSIYMAQAAESGKPAFIQEKMAVGKLEKFYKEIVLTEQEFIKDSSMTIADYAAKVGKELGDTVKVEGFVRFAFGE